METPRFLAAGETALVVEYGDTADPAHHDRVLALDAALDAHPIAGITETVPTYRSLMIHFDPRRLSTEKLIAALEGVAAADVTPPRRKRWCVPACYDAPYGEDLEEAARELRRTPEEIVALHATATYRVVMYGFAPGFVFLSGLPEALAISRRRTPRPPAPAGALTIANGQALIASIEMPTGWYMVGRTPARTFDISRTPMFPIGVGDEVTFERIDAARFAALSRDDAGVALLADTP